MHYGRIFDRYVFTHKYKKESIYRKSGDSKYGSKCFGTSYHKKPIVHYEKIF